MTVQFLFNLEQFSDVNSIILGVVKFYGHSVLGFFVNKGLNYELTFNVKDKVRTVVIDDHDLSQVSRLLKSSDNSNFLGCIELDIYVESGINCEVNTKALYPNLPSKLYLATIATRGTQVSNIPGHFQFNVWDFNVSNVEIIASVDFEDHISKIQEVLFFDIKVYGAYILKVLQLGVLSYLYESKGKQRFSADCEWKINAAKEEFTKYLSSVENAEINVPTIKVVEQETQKLLPPSKDGAREILVKTDDQEISKETVINTNTNTNNNTEVKPMTNNFVFSYNTADINKASKQIKGKLTIPAAWVKRNASNIPACLFSVGAEQYIQFEYMNNVRLVKMNNLKDPNICIKNVCKDQTIIQIVFSLDMSSRKDLRFAEDGIPLVSYNAETVVGTKTSIVVREFNSEEFAFRVLQIKNVMEAYIPILETSFLTQSSFIPVVVSETASSVAPVVIPCANINTKETKTMTNVKPVTNNNAQNDLVEAIIALGLTQEEYEYLSNVNGQLSYLKKGNEYKLGTLAQNKLSAFRAAKETMVVTDDQANAKETVTYSPVNNTNNTEETTMSNFKFERNAEINSQAKKEDSVEDTVKQTSTVQVPVQINNNNNTNTNTEVKTMTVLATSSNAQEQQVINEFEITVEDFQAIKALNLGKPFFMTTGRGNLKLVAEVEALFSNAAPIQAMPVIPVVSQPVEIEADPGMPNSTIAKLCAEQAASNEVVETVEDNNTNTSIPKSMPKVNVVRQLESIELVINIIAAAGGDIARKSGAVAKRTDNLNVLRNKNQNTVSNIRGYGFIRSNSADDAAFMSVNVFPEVAQTIYQTSNRPVVIFNYSDGTSIKQNTAETEIFWRKVLHAGDDVVIANLNPTLKFDLDVSGELLRERIDAGTVQAVSVKFNDLSKMFRFWVGNYNVMSILNLSLVSGYEVSILRDTVELTEDFLGYKSGSAKFNDYSAFSKTNRKGNSAVVGQALVGYGEFTPKSVAQTVPSATQVVAARAVEVPVAVAVVVDAEKDALRVENADLKAKVADLTSQVSNLVAGQARMEALLAQLVPAQTPVVSIPEIVEVVAPAADSEKSEEEILAEMRRAREDFYHSEVTNCGCDDRDEDEAEELALELKAMDDTIALFVELMPIPVADREVYLANKAAKKAADWAAFQASGDFFM